MIGQVDDLVGIAGQGRGVAGHEVLAVADAQHDRTAQAGDDEHFRPIAEEDRQAVGSLELQQGLLHRGDQGPVVQRRHVFHGRLPLQTACHQVRDDLGIGGRMERVALFDQATLERLEVLDHAIVNDGNLAVATQVGVGVDVARCTVGGPAGVPDARPARGRMTRQAWLPGDRSARPTCRPSDAAAG